MPLLPGAYLGCDFFFLPGGSANGPLRLRTQFFLLFMCMASTSCSCTGFCIVWSLTLCITASEMAGTMKEVYRLPHHMSLCAVCLDLGTFQTSLCPLAYFTDMPLCPLALPEGLPPHPWHSLQMSTPFHPSMPCRSPSLRPVAPIVDVHPCPCSSLHPQANFVFSDPHLTLRSPLEPWPALLSASSPQKGPWASVGTWYKPYRGFD